MKSFRQSVPIIIAAIIMTASIAVIALLLSQHPEFLPGSDRKAGYDTPPSTVKVYMHETYYEVMLENIVDSLIPEGVKYSQYDKCKLIHDFVVSRVDYDYGSYTKNRGMELNKKGNDPERALKEGTGLCFAYAQLFKDLCDVAGLHCTCILGSIVDSRGIDGHGWCVVQIDGLYYHIDPCWDDGGISDSPVNYEWFLIGKTKASNRGDGEKEWIGADWSTFYTNNEEIDITHELENMSEANYKVNRDKLKSYTFEYVYSWDKIKTEEVDNA